MLCKECNEEIPLNRLEALPYTKLCVLCSKKSGGEYDVVVIEENLGSSIVSRPIIYFISNDK